MQIANNTQKYEQVQTAFFHSILKLLTAFQSSNVASALSPKADKSNIQANGWQSHLLFHLLHFCHSSRANVQMQ